MINLFVELSASLFNWFWHSQPNLYELTQLKVCIGIVSLHKCTYMYIKYNKRALKFVQYLAIQINNVKRSVFYLLW